jgi:hypothetical protein
MIHLSVNHKMNKLVRICFSDSKSIRKISRVNFYYLFIIVNKQFKNMTTVIKTACGWSKISKTFSGEYHLRIEVSRTLRF